MVIFTPGQPDFGGVLADIIREDGRIDGDVIVLDSEGLFEAMIRFPHVKLVVVSLAEEVMMSSWESMLWFFDGGGGLVGLGYAGSLGSTSRAAESAFPLFGNDYKSGKYDPQRKRFTQTFLVDEPHIISEGLGDFSPPAQRLILSTNLSTGEYSERRPGEGELSVLYRDAVYSAPVLVAYQGNGTSVTFATFGGEDYERSFGYHGIFAQSEEFTTLFTNAVSWVWEGESRYEGHLNGADEFYSRLRVSDEEVKSRAEELERASKRNRTARALITIAAALLSSYLLYWALLVRPKGREIRG